MPVSLLVRAVEVPGLSDPTTLVRKGDIIAIKPPGWEWGASETLPNWVKVNISNSDTASAKAYLEQWRRLLQYEQVSADDATSVYRYRIYSDKVRSSDGVGQVLASEVQSILDKWGSEVVSVSLANGIVFDLDTSVAYRSNGFWIYGNQGISVNNSYDQPSLTHSVVVDYSGYAEGRNKLLMAVDEVGLEITYHDVISKEFGFDVTSVDIRKKIKFELEDMAETTFGRRRYRVSGSSVDAVVNAGGEVTVTAAQFINAIVDLLA